MKARSLKAAKTRAHQAFDAYLILGLATTGMKERSVHWGFVPALERSALATFRAHSAPRRLETFTSQFSRRT